MSPGLPLLILCCIPALLHAIWEWANSLSRPSTNFNENDEFSIFLIIDGLFEINETYAQDYILEYFANYNL